MSERLKVMERRGDRFDTVLATLRWEGVILGTLISAFGAAILLKLGVI